MFKSQRSTQWMLITALSLGAAGAVTWAADKHTSGTDEMRIDTRLTKDADDHLKSNLGDPKLHDALKQELVRAEAVRQMAEVLARDSQFEHAYGELLKQNDKRWAETMPTEADVIKEKERVINDEAGTRMVMAKAITILAARDAHK